MPKYFLAVDIGASGGRHYAGYIEDDRLNIREIHRFANSPARDGSHLVWDTEVIFTEILAGMKKCAAAGITPVSVGVDTWGVDYVLLDGHTNKTGKSYSYRDKRTYGMEQRFDASMSPKGLYERTGIQRMPINTLYQLMAHMDEEPGDFDKARRLLMLPDYFHFLLAGELCSEYTVASTSQLVNAVTKDWDRDVMAAAGIPGSLFGDLHLPGARLGTLQKGIADEVGYSCDVVLPCAHDTASAVAALPIAPSAVGGGPLYVSSGTWSLIGCESAAPVLTDKCRKMNFTNEGGYGYRYRLLKNIMGLWMIQSVRRELVPGMSFDELSLAASEADIDTKIDCEDKAFLSPDSMHEAIRDWCGDRGLRAPTDAFESAAVIYGSLADSYACNAAELADVTGREFTDIFIIGGGSKDRYLNELAARATGMTIHAGPSEATAVGNILTQMISAGVFSGLDEAKACVRNSFEIKTYEGSAVHVN
ncbi:MAG: rhamnulokinase [Clostridiales Family XIII bacterium]|jgi:rhamnulokinase|nr:rhamnulokinase [Clostridiales Family XIII bacterium]